MAVQSRAAARRQAAVGRKALFVVLAVCAIVLLGRRGPLLPHSSRALVEDDTTAARLYQLAKASGDASEFASKLQQAGLMASHETSSSSGSSSSGGKDGGGSASESKKGGGGGKKGGGKAAGGKHKGKVPQLSRELAHSYARDGIIIVTWANLHFLDFTLNWVHHMQVHGITNYLVGAMDKETGEALASEGLNVFAMYDTDAADTGLGTADFGWGTAAFHKMGRQKVDLARTFTDFDLDLCLCDVDTVWINDPTEYFERYPQAHILASSDHLVPTNEKGDDGPEQPEGMHSAMNIGLIFFRHGKNTTHFIDAWQKQLDADAEAWDQNVFNWVAHEGLVPFKTAPDEPRLVYGANHSLLFGVLPVAQFGSGHTFFVQRLFEFQKVKPYVVHCTFQYGGSAGKRHRLREALLWVDSPEYYSEGKFLSVDLDYLDTPADFQIQDEVMMGGRFKTGWEGNDMVDFHLKASRRQLTQLKTAFQLAVALNRTIIMPKLLAWCDRYWGPLEFCQVPGAFKTRLPFVAPMDHFLEPANFGGWKKDQEQPIITYREYSFLANERTPKALKERRIVIKPTPSATVTDLKKDGDQKVVQLPPNLSDAQLRKALAPWEDAPLLHFSGLDGAFGKWEDNADRDAFQRRLDRMWGFHCCKQVKKGEDGGFAYGRLVNEGLPG